MTFRTVFYVFFFGTLAIAGSASVLCDSWAMSSLESCQLRAGENERKPLKMARPVLTRLVESGSLRFFRQHPHIADRYQRVPAEEAIANQERVIVIGSEHGVSVLQEWQLAGWDADDKNSFRAFVKADLRCDDLWLEGEWRLARETDEDIRLTFHACATPPVSRSLPNPVRGCWW